MARQTWTMLYCNYGTNLLSLFGQCRIRTMLQNLSLSQTARLLVSILDEVVTAFVEDMDNVVLGAM